MEALIRVMNRVQDAFSEIGIHDMKALDLPQIVVVGAQSAGKSSVLESLVGRDFLPRGSGIVTRRPLVLQLIHLDEKTRKRYDVDPTIKEFGQFNHQGSKTFADFDEIRAEIEHETDRSMGSNKGIGSDPIRLKIFSEYVVDLTLVDLPGLTKVPVGDQPEDIEDQVRGLILNFIESSSSVILAVTPGHDDMATSESLKLAKHVDPDGRRTLAVITKLDRVDEGVNAREVLNGSVIEVKLGIIGVINRSQHGINTSKKISEAREDEKKFLNKYYPDIAHQHGTVALSHKLNTLLMSHINTRLPDLRNRISELTKANKEQLSQLGQPVVDKESCLMRLIIAFIQAYSATLNGTDIQLDANTKEVEVKGGALISQQIFQDAFPRGLFEVDALGDLELKTIVQTLRLAAGLVPPLTVPDKAFQALAKRQIARMMPPCLQCVDLVHDEMQRCIRRCGDAVLNELAKYPKIFEAMVGIVSEHLKKTAEYTADMVKYIIEIQVNYINPKHPEFCQEMEALLEERSAARSENGGEGDSQDDSEDDTDFIAAIRAKLAKEKQSGGAPNFLTEEEKYSPENLPPRELEDVELMKKLVTKYYVIVQKIVYDSVPKAIVYSLVERTRASLYQVLFTELYIPAATSGFAILEEAVEITERRKNIMAMLGALKEATKSLNEVWTL